MRGGRQLPPYYNPMTKKIKPLTTAEQQAIANKQVNLSGEGEAAAVKALLSDKFTAGTNAEALDIALDLQEIMRGQNSILSQVNSNNSRVTDELQRLHARMAEYDTKAEQFEADRAKFLAEVDKLADKVRVSGEEKDKLVAKGAIQFQEALASARANAVVSRLKFEDELVHMRTETVVSPGTVEVVSVSGQPTPKIFPEAVHIKHKVWVLPPGRPVEVPFIVAEVLRQRRQMEEEQSERKAALSAQSQDTVLAQKWDTINRKYGTTGDPLPIGSN
jgi:uncharacterized protein YfcZ (UPF0381/DUF406 family)